MRVSDGGIPNLSFSARPRQPPLMRRPLFFCGVIPFGAGLWVISCPASRPSQPSAPTGCSFPYVVGPKMALKSPPPPIPCWNSPQLLLDSSTLLPAPRQIRSLSIPSVPMGNDRSLFPPTPPPPPPPPCCGSAVPPGSQGHFFRCEVSIPASSLRWKKSLFRGGCSVVRKSIYPRVSQFGAAALPWFEPPYSLRFHRPGWSASLTEEAPVISLFLSL